MQWWPVATFIVVALGLSFPVQQGYLDDAFAALVGDSIFSGLSYLLAGFSTLLAALIGLGVHRGLSSTVSVFGATPFKHFTIFLLPIIAFGLLGRENPQGMNPWLYGFLAASVASVYAFAEEIGWRRYLQNALHGLSPYVKYAFIGVVWWIWHFRFDTPFDLFVFPLICLCGGVLLGRLADETRSVLPVVAMHSLVTLTTTGSFGTREMGAIALVFAGWFGIEKLWLLVRPAADGDSALPSTDSRPS